jgi:hypothetical protein
MGGVTMLKKLFGAIFTNTSVQQREDTMDRNMTNVKKETKNSNRLYKEKSNLLFLRAKEQFNQGNIKESLQLINESNKKCNTY